MEEQGVIRLSTADKPVHRLNHVGPSGQLPLIPGIVREHDDVLGSVVVSVYLVSFVPS